MFYSLQWKKAYVSNIDILQSKNYYNPQCAVRKRVDHPLFHCVIRIKVFEEDLIQDITMARGTERNTLIRLQRNVVCLALCLTFGVVFSKPGMQVINNTYDLVTSSLFSWSHSAKVKCQDMWVLLMYQSSKYFESMLNIV